MSFLLWLGAHLFLHNLWIVLTAFLTKGLILFGLAYGATRLFPSLLAEHRHTIWFLITLSLVLLPVGRLFVAVVPINLPDSSFVHSVSRLVTLPAAYGERITSIIDASIIDASRVDFGAAVVTARRLLLLLPVSLWMMGVAFFILRYVGGRVALRRLAISPAVSRPVPLAELARRMGIRRRLSVVYSARCAIPLTYGWLHPRIMLPAASRAWPGERLRAVLIHELTHIKRADYLSNAVVYLVCAFLWFIPFAWLAREFMLREAEVSCDRSVLTSGMTGTEYATAIVDIVRGAQGQFLLPGAYGIIRRESLLKERIRRVLNSSSQSNNRVRTGGTLLLCLSLLVLLFALTYSLEAGEKLHAQTAHLFEAVVSGRPQDVQAAIDKGADVNARDTSGQTALLWAVTYNQDPTMISILLKGGTDIEARDPVHGGTALLWAAFSNQNPAVITALLKAGADINSRGKGGWTPLMKAALGNQNPAVITTLLGAGADANARDSAGKTALDYARGRAKLEGTDAYRLLQERSQ